MKVSKNRLSAADLDKLVHKWWETTVLDATGEYVWDEEVKAVNSMMAEIDEFPEWALQVRDAMPKYGFEMCSHRWLDGLDHVIGMIGAEEFHPSNAGRCGDVPGRIVHAAEQRATAVQFWIEGVSPKNVLGMQVADWLGKPTPEKREAARCYVELIQAYFLKSEDYAKARSSRWRALAEKNEILKLMFEGEGFDSLLQNSCGFKIIDRLDLYIRIIGGDHSQLADRHGVCNDQLRFILQDDPGRLETTVGYLWRWYAYLLGKDEAWLRESKPDYAGAAIYALRGVSRAGKPTPLRRWLVASLLKSTKIWCQCAFNSMPSKYVPAYARDLPDVIAAITTEEDFIRYLGDIVGEWTTDVFPWTENQRRLIEEAREKKDLVEAESLSVELRNKVEVMKPILSRVELHEGIYPHWADKVGGGFAEQVRELIGKAKGMIAEEEASRIRLQEEKLAELKLTGVEVRIRIEANSAKDSYERTHGMTFDRSLLERFWLNQEDAVIDTRPTPLTHEETVVLLPGPHYMIYGNSAATSAGADFIWDAKVYINGKLEGQGQVSRDQFLRVTFTIPKQKREP